MRPLRGFVELGGIEPPSSLTEKLHRYDHSQYLSSQLLQPGWLAESSFRIVNPTFWVSQRSLPAVTSTSVARLW